MNEDDEDGGASSRSTLEPQMFIAYAGASRSMGCVMWCRAEIFLDARNRGSESWYRSAKMKRGRVKYV